MTWKAAQPTRRVGATSSREVESNRGEYWYAVMTLCGGRDSLKTVQGVPAKSDGGGEYGRGRGGSETVQTPMGLKWARQKPEDSSAKLRRPPNVADDLAGENGQCTQRR